MDKDIVAWILEFLARQQVSPSLLNAMLTNPHFSVPQNNNPRLKRTICLNTIQNKVSSGEVGSELVLESLEIIEELDRKEGNLISDSMKQAYRAVAVEYTVKYLRVPGKSREEDQAQFFEAVMIIWRERIEKMERLKKSELVTNELRELSEEMEMALWDSEACKRLVGRFEPGEAVRLVRAYVNEALAIMGPSFIELRAEIALKRKQNTAPQLGQELKRKRNDGERVETEEASKLNDSPQVVDLDGPARQEIGELHQNDVYEACFRESPHDIRDSQKVGTSKCNLNLVSIPEFVKVREALKLRFVDFKAMVDELQQNDVYEDCSLESPHHIMDSQKGETGKCNLNLVSTPRFVKVREALMHSFADLKAMVIDPLPEALRVSDVLRAEMREKSLNKETSVENQNGNNIGPAPINAEVSGAVMESLDPVSSLVNQNMNTTAETPLSSQQIVPPLNSTASTFQVPETKEKTLNPETSVENRNVNNAPSPTINAKVSEAATEILNRVPSQVILNRTNDSELPTSSHKIVPPKCSLMERNSTAKTFEWNDSIDSMSQEATHSMDEDNLPTESSRRKFASFKANKLSARRKPHKFSLEEEDALREGVRKFGIGSWTLILNSKRSVFIDRTAVDLKDKWRNMMKSGDPLKYVQ